ncbi:DUF5694 domain-containing protein [Taibaiella chishuiensis]|uniref:TraB family protein n=1 Tax=Taibaiella chishuiensis TaxID=1434707 RepID=A0A2P8CXM5_9BACT|nr:DUF5694 domain-containing protein [Taibaiella chishuiensis]PSK89735.1 hypothetical protein B0I18_11034 [Taibaiella chishuiensis]
MKRYLALCALLCFWNYATAQTKNTAKEALLLGVFHFNNPGADLAKTETFNVMSKQAQQELEVLAAQIKKFRPDKIFVEWDYDDQPALDTLYDLYRKGQYFSWVQSKYPDNAFYTQNEIFQLAFRAGKLAGLQKIHAIDVQMNWPFDSLQLAIQKAGQTTLQREIEDQIVAFSEHANALMKKMSLTRILLEENTKATRDKNLGMYITLLNKGGALTDFTGASVVDAWYRRNLYMYSLVQKLTAEQDKRIMIIVGAGHAALFKHFIDLDENYKVTELADVLKK